MTQPDDPPPLGERIMCDQTCHAGYIGDPPRPLTNAEMHAAVVWSQEQIQARIDRDGCCGGPMDQWGRCPETGRMCARLKSEGEKRELEVREMDINSCFPGSYLKAADLGGRTIKVLIDRVQEEDIGGENKPVMYFVGKDKGLVLNKTNAGVIAAVHGSETEEWTGKGLVLFSTKVSFQGSMVDAIRLRCDVPEAAPDEIPF